jgi:nucleotide-binding universal stress UspA family protein
MKTDKIKTVLIALDYDPTAQKVAETGFSLAKTMGAQIVLLNIIEDATFLSAIEYAQIPGFMGFNDAEASRLFDNGIKKAMKHFLDKSKIHLGDVNIQTVVKEGSDFAESILDAAKDFHTDIIVMGSHSRKWLENIVIGSVTEKVLRLTTIPLFIVPTKKHN